LATINWFSQKYRLVSYGKKIYLFIKNNKLWNSIKWHIFCKINKRNEIVGGNRGFSKATYYIIKEGQIMNIQTTRRKPLIAQAQRADASPDKEDFALMVDYKKNGIQVKTLVDSPTGKMKLFAFTHGTKLKKHRARHDAQLFVLEGVADVTIEGRISQVQTGDTITLPAKRAHAVEAKTPFKMLLITWSFLLYSTGSQECRVGHEKSPIDGVMPHHPIIKKNWVSTN